MSRLNGHSAKAQHAQAQAQMAEAAQAAALASLPQTTFPSVQMEVVPEKEAARTLIVVTPLGILRFPMTGEYANNLSKRLVAPSMPTT